MAAKDKEREQCDKEKEVLAKQFEQRIAGMRLEREQSKLDKALFRRLEKEMGELKSLSASVLGPLAQRGTTMHDISRWEAQDELRARLAEDELLAARG